MSEYQKHIDQKKPDTNGYILLALIYVKLKTEQN